MSNEISQQLSNIMFGLKEKITDSEYMECMELLSKLNTKEKQKKLYEVTIAIPNIRTLHNKCENHDTYYGTKHEVGVSVKSFTTTIKTCNEIQLADEEKCWHCLNNQDTTQCNRINLLNTILNQQNYSVCKNTTGIRLKYLIKHVDDKAKEYLELLVDYLNNMSELDDIHVEYLHDEDDNEDEGISRTKIKHKTLEVLFYVNVISVREIPQN